MSTGTSDAAQILQQLREGALRFVHAPQLWEECNLPVDLEWQSVEFGKDHRGKVPSDKFGVYAFMLEPNFTGPPKGAYLLYVGKTKRTFWKRYGEYLPPDSGRLARLAIGLQLDTWDGHVWFHYAQIKDTGVLDPTEDALLNACIPPLNSEFKGTVGEAVRAFRLIG